MAAAAGPGCEITPSVVPPTRSRRSFQVPPGSGTSPVAFPCLRTLIPLPAVLFFQDRAGTGAVKPFAGSRIVAEMGIPKGGGESEDRSMVVRVAPLPIAR